MMTVLGRGLVFQPVLVTQTCTYNSNNIIGKEKETERERGGGGGEERGGGRETGLDRGKETETGR